MTLLIPWSWPRRPASAGRRDHRQPGLARRSRNPLTLELLEARCLPSTVTNLDDAGPGSLRQAVLDTPSGGIVDFQPGLAGTITLATGELAITKDLTIQGPGSPSLTVSGNHAGRVFDVPGPFMVTLSGLTIADGQLAGNQFGAGIANAGNLTITNSTLSDNSCISGSGGGIYNTGTLTLTDSTLSASNADAGGGIYNLAGTVFVSGSTFSDNSVAAGFGGGIYNDGGSLTVCHSTLDGNGAFGESSGAGIYNRQDGSVTLIDSTLSHNLAETGGGVTNNGGTVTVIGSTLSSNTGGGIYSYAGTVTVTDSTLDANSLSYAGGGGIANSGTLTVTGSTLNGNSALYGGGIANYATLIVTNSTLNGNRTTDTTYGGGGIYSYGPATVASSTLSGNLAAAAGGGLDRAGSGNLTVRNTLIAGNTARSSSDASGSLDSQGYNLIGNGDGASGWTDTDFVGTPDDPIDPLLGPLQDNGGPTPTMALMPGSPALNAGDPDELGTADQRGVVRGGGVNIGAYQASATAFVLSAPAKVTAGVPSDLTVTAVDPFGQLAAGYAGTVTFATTDPDPGVVLPADYAFTPADGGTHTFAETTLRTRGQQVITATDTADSSITGSTTVKVRHMRHHDGESVIAPSDPKIAAADRFFTTPAQESSSCDGPPWHR